VISGREIIRFDAPIGNRSPMHTLAMGKAILAFRPVEEQDAYIESCDFRPFTPNTITDPSKFHQTFQRSAREDMLRTTKNGSGHSMHCRTYILDIRY
jgi:DNA-binding IclR family transcriptional regulator